MLTPGQPVPNADPRTPGRVATGVAIFKATSVTRPLVRLDPEKPGIEPRVCRLRGGRLNHKAFLASLVRFDQVQRGTSPGSPALYGGCWLVACLSSQQHASVSQGRICSDNLTCCHTETEVADPTFYLARSQYTDTGLTSPSADPVTPGAWQGSHWSANF